MDYQVPGLTRTYSRLNDRYGFTWVAKAAPKNADIVGWFSNSYNPGGWNIIALEDWEKDLLLSEGLGGLANVYRVASDNGTTLAKFNFKTGFVAFFDNRYYEETDRARWAPASQYRKAILAQDIANQLEGGGATE